MRPRPRPAPAGRRAAGSSGSRPDPRHSPAARDRRRSWRRSSRASSIQVRSLAHAVSRASCAISTVGSRVDGSRSKVSSRCRPYVSSTVSTSSGSTSSASSSLRATRRRVSWRPSPIVTSRRNTCRIARCPSGSVVAKMRSARADKRPADPPDLLEGREGQPIVVASLEQLGERVLQQRERAGLMGDVGDDLGHEAGLGGRCRPPRRAVGSPARARRA